MRSKFRAAVAVVVLVLAATPSTFAQLSYVSQSRFVYASVGAAAQPPATQTIHASDFGGFDQTATATLTGMYPGSATASQVSSLLPTGVSIVATFTAARPTAAGTGSASGQSSLDAVFTVDGTTPFTLSGLMPAGEGAGFPLADVRSVQLTGPGVAIDLAGPNNFSETGTLTPGQYHLVVDGSVAANSLHSQPIPPGFNVALETPEPASTAVLLGGLTLLRRRRPLVA